MCLISSALCHEDIWGSGGTAPLFLTMTLNGVEWSASCPSYFTPRERAPVPTGEKHGWTPVSLDTVERKILHCWKLSLGHPAHSYTNSLYGEK
jgi:hypothetical protein